MRYKTTLGRDINGKRIVNNGNIIPPPPQLNDVYVQVTANDRLDQLAHYHYNNKALWYVIAAANNIGKGTVCIHEGTILRIPSNPLSGGGGY